MGAAVAIDGNTAVVGAPGVDTRNGADVGMVSIIDGNTTLIGAQGDDYPGLADVGSAYLFGCAACPAITVNPATLPNGRIGALYSSTFTATGGTGSYTFKVVTGTLPPGLTLSSSRTLSGVPSATGAYNFTVRALMGNFCPGDRTYTLTVSGACPAVTVSPTNSTLPIGTTASFTNTSEVYDPATNAWTPTEPMNSARVLHTVTLLPNGKVLAAGGSAASFNPILQRTTEIYDPATNAWTLTGELTTPRMTHTTTLLANGKVLLTGGSSDGSGTIIANVELYDPATGEWSATGSMTTPRVLHTLTLLPNGKVLAVGGASANTGGLLRSSEIYDPATGNWAAAAELAAGRQNHTATLLLNGKVLAVAGSGAGQLTSAEIYDHRARRG